MSRFKTGLILLLSTAACGSGSQIVEFALDASASDGNASDVSVKDAATDGPRDGASDGASDGGDASIAPLVVTTTPLDKAISVSINERPTATFNEAMDPTTIVPTNFTLMQGATQIPIAVALNANTVTLTPLSSLDVNQLYTATVTTGAKAATSVGGLPLVANYTWSFSTGACSQGPVALGSAASFVVLAGSTVTSTLATSLTGDMGVSPGTAIVGFPPGTINGTIHAGDSTAATAIGDLTTAYNEVAGRTLCPITVAGNLGGQTLTPGLYKSVSSLAISSGDLTLDAQGDGDQVFVFQMATTLTTTGGRKVILAGGAKSTNVYWQVGTSATLGTTTSFQGTIMADQSITLDTGATLNGRALARIGAVTMDTNTIVKPAP